MLKSKNTKQAKEDRRVKTIVKNTGSGGGHLAKHRTIMIWNIVADTYSNNGFKHIGLFLLLALYSALGGFVFSAFESGHEEEELTMTILNSTSAKNDLKARLLSIFSVSSLTDDMKADQAAAAILVYDQRMGIRIIDVESDRQWTIWGGLYYAGTIYTTIGYGDIAAKTTWGRVATIVYTLFGIPLVIKIFSDWGSLLFILMQKMWNKYLIVSIDWMASVLPLACRQRSSSILPSRMDESFTAVQHHGDGHALPLKFVLFLFFFWAMLCAAIFCIFEPNWNYATSLYFFFISLTTVGLGDIVPNHKVAVLNFLLIFIGISVLSMSIKVIEVKLDKMFKKIISSIDHDFKKGLENDKKSGRGAQPTTTLGVIQHYSNAMKFTDKLLLTFMGSHEKKILTERFDEKSKLRSNWTQTDRRGLYDVCVQTGDESLGKGISVFEDDGPHSRFSKKRLYIYHVGD